MYSYDLICSDTITPNQLKKIERFIADTVDPGEPAAGNMGRDNPAGLLYNIDHKLRWCVDQGAIFLIYDNSEPVAISCVEYPENTDQFAIGGIRTWIKRSHRATQIAGYFLDLHCRWARHENCAFMLITFNDYNRAGYLGVRRGPKFRKAAGWSTWWDDCVALEQPLNIRNTEQWCVIKPIYSDDTASNIKVLERWATSK